MPPSLASKAPSEGVEMNDVNPLDAPSPESQVDSDYAPPPIDGGLAGWSSVAGAWFVQFCTVGIVTAFGVYQDYYTEDYLAGTQSESNIAWVGSMQLFLELALGPIGGILMDKGYFRAVTISGSVIFLFSFFMLSLAQPQGYYQIFLSQGIGMGLGIGLLYLPTTGLVSSHFQKRKALAMGIITTGGSLGGAVFSIMMNQLLHNPSISWGWSNRIAAFIALLCLLLSQLLMRERPRPSKPSKPLSSSPTTSPSPPPTPSHLFTPAYILALIGGFTVCLGLYTVLFYIQVFGNLNGVSTELSFYSLAILNFSSCFGRTMPNYFADKVGIFKVFVPCIVISGILSFGLLGCNTAPGIVLVAITYGFFSGAAISLYFPMLMRLKASPADVGKRLGFSGVPLGIAMGVGPPITGALIGTNGHDYLWYRGMIFAAVTQIFGAACLGLLGLRVTRGKA